MDEQEAVTSKAREPGRRARSHALVLTAGCPSGAASLAAGDRRAGPGPRLFAAGGAPAGEGCQGRQREQPGGSTTAKGDAGRPGPTSPMVTSPVVGFYEPLTSLTQRFRGPSSFDATLGINGRIVKPTWGAWHGRYRYRHRSPGADGATGFTNQTRNVHYSCNDGRPADDDHDSNDLGGWLRKIIAAATVRLRGRICYGSPTRPATSP
jgi:hypothetical protein